MRRQWKVAAVLLSSALVFAVGMARAQVGSVASAMGTVSVNNEPIKDAEVILKSLDTARECKAKTDKNGEFLCRLMAGRYMMTVKIKGTTVHSREVNVRGGMFGEISSPGFANRFDVPLTTQAQSEEARKQQEEAQKKAQAEYDKAKALNEEGKHEEAILILNEMIQKDPEQWVLYWQLAVAHTGLNQLEEAAASYQKAIELNPSEAALYNTLGQLYIKMGRLEDAGKQFETAAQLSPEKAASAYYNMGVNFYNSGDLKAAIEPLRKATELDPQRADAFYWLGVCLYSNAQYKKEGSGYKTVLLPDTRESFERYLALAPDGRYANDAKAILEAIDTTIPATVRVEKKK